jgi:hypothetical protein
VPEVCAVTVAVATNFVPSAEDAMELQYKPGALVKIHVPPESLET